MLVAMISLCCVSCVNAQEFKKIVIQHNDIPQEVHYDYYIPTSKGEGPSPVLVCIGGLPIIDGQYVHANPQECMGGAWKTFADENNVVVLGLGFLFKEEDWPTKTSYQHPKAWSGKALIKILDILSEVYTIKKDELYMFGISAGAQYSTRFALLYPEFVKGVAAHAAGGYDLPEEFIDTKFLITVGENDNGTITRVEWAQYFEKGCKEKGIDIRLEIIPEIAHRQTEEQNDMSRLFYTELIQSGE